ncbi:MAG: MFS transporter [bacterium]|nr:MFS transporter [bacterium]
MKNEHKRVGVFGQVIGIPAFRYLWVAQLCSQLAANALLFVLALRVYEATKSNTAVSVLFLVYGLAALLFGVAGGTIVDKLDSRRVLVGCDLGRAGLVLGFLLFPNNIVAIYILMFLNAIITQLYVPAEAPTIPRIVPSNLLVAANSLFSFTYFTSLAVGSTLAGPLLRLFGVTGVFLFLFFLFLVAGWNASRIPIVKKKIFDLSSLSSFSLADILSKFVRNTTEGFQYVRKSPVLAEALVFLAGTQVILAILGTLAPGFADRVLQVDLRDATLLITGPVVLGIILGALWVGHVGSAYRPVCLIERGIMGGGILLFLISFIVWGSRALALSRVYREGIVLPLLLVLFFFLGVANSFLDVPANSILQKEAQGDVRGRVYGILTSAVGGIGILPVVLGGILADTIGSVNVMFLMGLLITLYGLFRRSRLTI